MSRLARKKRRHPGLVLFLIGLVAVSLWIGDRSLSHHLLKPPPAPIIRHYTPVEAVAAQRHVQVFRDSLQTPSVSSRAKSSQPVTIRLSETDLNAYVATEPRLKSELEKQGVQALQIMLRPPANGVIRATLRLHGETVNTQVEGTLQPDPKTCLGFDVTQAQIDRLSVPPQSVAKLLDKIIQQIAGQIHDRPSVTIQTVTVADDMLILRGVRNSVH